MADCGDEADEAAAQAELSDKEKKDIAAWFLSNAPVGEISYVAKGFSFSHICMYIWNGAFIEEKSEKCNVE
jgi:hypothetical protein